jgi:hypothetical protein
MTFSSLALADVRDFGCSTVPPAVSRFSLSLTVGARLTVRVIRVSFTAVLIGLGANGASAPPLAEAAAGRPDPMATVQEADLPTRRHHPRGPSAAGRKPNLDRGESHYRTTEAKSAALL